MPPGLLQPRVSVGGQSGLCWTRLWASLEVVRGEVEPCSSRRHLQGRQEPVTPPWPRGPSMHLSLSAHFNLYTYNRSIRRWWQADENHPAKRSNLVYLVYLDVRSTCLCLNSLHGNARDFGLVFRAGGEWTWEAGASYDEGARNRLGRNGM